MKQSMQRFHEQLGAKASWSRLRDTPVESPFQPIMSKSTLFYVTLVFVIKGSANQHAIVFTSTFNACKRSSSRWSLGQEREARIRNTVCGPTNDLHIEL